MRAGQLDRRITLQAKTVTQADGWNTDSITWATFGTARMPAQVQDVLTSKGESQSEGIRIASRPARVRIRYLDGITSDMRLIVHGANDRTMQIVSGPAEIGRREWLEFMAEEYSTAGA